MKRANNNTESDDLVSNPALKTKVAKSFDVTYAFKQQLLTAWRPKPTHTCAIAVYLVIGLVFFTLGIIILVFTNNIYEKTIRYDNNSNCSTIGISCEAGFNISKDMKAPVYVYYRINGFYQNHRKYVKSIPIEQLNGKDLAPSSLTDCKPYLYNIDMQVTTAVDGTPLNPNDVAIPCGVAAKYRFTDDFTVTSKDTNIVYPISGTGIAWQSDIKHKFKNIDLSRQWIDMENERFINWMKVAPFNDFMKSYGVINEDMPAGNYKVTIQNRWDVSIFDGEKFIILSETNVFGGKNEFLAYTYIAVGVFSIVLSIVFIFRRLRRPKGILHKVYSHKKYETNAELDIPIN